MIEDCWACSGKDSCQCHYYQRVPGDLHVRLLYVGAAEESHKLTVDSSLGAELEEEGLAAGERAAGTGASQSHMREPELATPETKR